MFSAAYRALTPSSWRVAQKVKSSPTTNHQNLFCLTVLKEQSVKATTISYIVSDALSAVAKSLLPFISQIFLR